MPVYQVVLHGINLFFHYNDMLKMVGL